jgi:hypothetical protein
MSVAGVFSQLLQVAIALLLATPSSRRTPPPSSA